MYRLMSNIVQITISFLSHALPLVVNHCSKHSKPLTPSKLGAGNCLFRAVSYAVTGRHENILCSRESANNKSHE